MNRQRWLRFGPAAVAVALGCQSTNVRQDAPPLEVRAQSADDKPAVLPPPADEKKAEDKPEAEKKDTEKKDAAPAGPPLTDAPAAPPTVPVSLDAVLRLGEQQSPQLAAARAKVEQAHAEEEIARLRWLPDVNVGIGYYRHEGGIQDQDGTLVRSSTGAILAGVDVNARFDVRAIAFAKLEAARKTLQSQGEVSRLDYELTLHAAERYIDILSALTGAAIAADALADLKTTVEPLRKAAVETLPLTVELRRYEVDLATQEQLTAKFRSQARQAALDLAYTLGIDSCADLVPVDPQLVPLALIDPARPECDLIAQALANGPGVRETEAILSLIQRAQCDANDASRFLPVLTAQALEGGFGAGPNANLTWDNRFDFGVQARWNLTDLLTADARRRASQAGIAQVQHRYADLRAKLTLGVRDSVETIRSGRDQMRITTEAVERAEASLALSKKRLALGGVAAGASYGEILLAERALVAARANHLTVVREFNKAQLRLLLLLGKSCP